MKNTRREFGELFSLIGKLIDNIAEALMKVLYALEIVGKLITKPVEIAIAILQDFENRRNEKKLKKERRKGSKKDSSSSLYIFGKEKVYG